MGGEPILTFGRELGVHGAVEVLEPRVQAAVHDAAQIATNATPEQLAQMYRAPSTADDR